LYSPYGPYGLYRVYFIFTKVERVVSDSRLIELMAESDPKRPKRRPTIDFGKRDEEDFEGKRK